MKIPIITKVIREVELSDSLYWLECCKKELADSYNQYERAIERVKRAREINK